MDEAPEQLGGPEPPAWDQVKDTFQKAFPDLDPKENQQWYETQRSEAIKQRKLSHATDFYRQHAEEFWGPGSALYGGERLPVYGAVQNVDYYKRLHGAVSAIEGGNANDDAYYVAGQHIAKQQYEAQRSLGQTAFDAATQVPGMIAEFAMTGGAGGAARKAGEEAVGRLAGKYLGARASAALGKVAGFGAEGATLSAMMPSTYGHMAAQSVDQNPQGQLETRNTAGAISRGAVSSIIDNAIIPGVAGAYEKAGSGGYASRVLKKSLLALAGVETSGDIKGLLHLSPEGGPVWNLGAAALSGDPAKVEQALKGATAAVVQMGLLESIVQAGRAGAKPVSEDQAANALARKLIEVKHYPAQGPEPGIDRPEAPQAPVEAPAAASALPAASPPAPAESPAGAKPATPEADVETMRQFLQALGVKTGGMKKEAIISKARENHFDQFQEQPAGSGAGVLKHPAEHTYAGNEAPESVEAARAGAGRVLGKYGLTPPLILDREHPLFEYLWKHYGTSGLASGGNAVAIRADQLEGNFKEAEARGSTGGKFHSLTDAYPNVYEGAAVHEAAHVLEHAALKEGLWERLKEDVPKEDFAALSTNATKDAREAFVEAYMARDLGRPLPPKLAEALRQMDRAFEEYFGKYPEVRDQVNRQFARYLARVEKETPRQPQSPVSPEAKPSQPAEQPGGTQPAKPAGLPEWNQTYLDRRKSGMSHDAARQAADLHHDEGQQWVHSGTKFEGNSFTAPDGSKQTIGVKRYEDGGVRLGIPDAEGELAHVVLVNNGDGTHHFEALEGKKPGLARALLDYAAERGITIRRARKGEGLGETPAGKDFWRKNAEQAGREAPKPAPQTGGRAGDFLENKVRQLGSREAVSRLYNTDSELDRQARLIAARVYPVSPESLVGPEGVHPKLRLLSGDHPGVTRLKHGAFLIDQSVADRSFVEDQSLYFGETYPHDHVVGFTMNGRSYRLLDPGSGVYDPLAPLSSQLEKTYGWKPPEQASAEPGPPKAGAKPELRPITATSRNELLDRIEQGEGKLTEQEKKILNDRLLWATSFRELGQETGVSHEQVRLLEQKALAKLGHSGSVDELHAGNQQAQPVVDAVEKGKLVSGQGLHQVDPDGFQHNARINQIGDAVEKLDALNADKRKKVANGSWSLKQEQRFSAESRRLRSVIDAGQGETGPVAREPGAAQGVPGSAPERGPEQSPPVRRAGPEAVQGGGEAGGPAPQGEETAGARGTAEPAPAGGQTPGNVVKLKAGPETPKQFEKEALDHGVFPKDLHGLAGDILKESKQAAEAHNAMLKEARAELKGHGDDWKYLTSERFEDADSVKGLDEVADHMEKRYPSSFSDRENPSDTLFRLLKEGNHRPLSEKESYSQALSHLIEVEHARREAAKAGGEQAFRNGLRAGEEDGAAEEGGDLAGEHAGGDASFDPAEFGKPLSESERGAGTIGGGQELPGARRTDLRVTALKNAQVDEERVKNGLPPLMAAARRTNPEVWDRAMDRLDKDPEAGARLVQELAKKTRSTTVDENALLLQRKIAVSNEYRRAMGEYLEAMKPENRRGLDALTIDGMERRVDDLYRQVDQLDKVTRSTGTEWGRAGQFRKQFAKEDFSLVQMMMEAQAAKKAPLTPEEQATIATLQKRIEELQARLDASEAAYVEQTGKGQGGVGSKAEADMTRSRVAAEGAKDEFRRLVGTYKQQARTVPQKMVDWLIKLRQTFVISSPQTLAKIAAASAERIGIGPLEEAAGSAWEKVPGFAKIAAMAPREGKGFSPAVEKQAFFSAVTAGFKDVWQTWKTGRSELDVLYGKDKDVPRTWLDFVGELHAAAKAPAVRAEFTRSFLKRLDFEVANGRDATSPGALQRIGLEAYKDSQAAKFQGDNRVVDAYNAAIARLRAPDSSPGAKTIGVGLKLALPVVRIPTNLVAETLTYATGAVTGTVRGMDAIFRRGVENLKPGEADLIMRQLKKGSLGAALLALGYLNPSSIGGYYSGKRKDDDVQAGGVRTPLGDLPSWVMHNPLLEVMQMGATIRRATDKKYRGEEQGDMSGVAAGVLGLAEEAPFVRQPIELAKGGLSLPKALTPKERGAYLGETFKSLAIPQAFQWLAGKLDQAPNGRPVPRKPRTFTQGVEMGVPGLRQAVPAR